MGLLSREALVVIVLAAFPHTRQAERLSSYIHAIFRMSTVTESCDKFEANCGIWQRSRGKIGGQELCRARETDQMAAGGAGGFTEAQRAKSIEIAIRHHGMQPGSPSP